MKKYLLVAGLLLISSYAYAQVIGGPVVTGGSSSGVQSLTTSGTSGAATLTGTVLNVPIYSSGSSGVSSFTGDGALLNNSVSTGAVTATLGNAAAYSFFGNSTGASAAPGYTHSPTVLSLTTSVGGSLTVGGNASLAGTTTANNLTVTGTCTGCGTTSAAGSNLAIQSRAATGTAFSGTTTSGLYVSTTNSTEIDFLASVTTANLIHLPVQGQSINSLAIGPQAMFGQTATNANNVAIGFGAGQQITTGLNNTAVGSLSIQQGLGGSQNTGVGVSALTFVSNGSNNTGIGYNAGSFFQSGNSNTTIGANVVGGGGSHSGSFNILIGSDSTTTTALTNTSTALGVGIGVHPGNTDTAFGNFSLAASTTNNNQNTAIGYNALNATTSNAGSAMNDIALGYNAGKSITTGANNVILGALSATNTLSIGSNNVLIGNSLDTTTSSTSNTINVGGVWTVTGTNTPSTAAHILNGSVSVPNVSTGTNADFACFATGNTFTLQTSACTISQRKLKENFVQLTDDIALRDLMMLKPMTFNFKPTSPPNADPNATSTQYGFIAEDVAAVDPNLSVYENDMKTPKSYRQEAMISMLVRVVQQHEREIKELKAQQKRHK